MKIDDIHSLFQTTKSGAYYVKRRQEKSTAILIAIILIFLVCHVHRLVFRIYEIALPDKSVYEHYIHCEKQGRYHVPVAIYFLSHTNHLFLVISSSANFIIYCVMGRQFRQTLKRMVVNFCRNMNCKWWPWVFTNTIVGFSVYTNFGYHAFL